MAGSGVGEGCWLAVAVGPSVGSTFSVGAGSGVAVDVGVAFIRLVAVAVGAFVAVAVGVNVAEGGSAVCRVIVTSFSAGDPVRTATTVGSGLAVLDSIQGRKNAAITINDPKTNNRIKYFRMSLRPELLLFKPIS